MGLEEKIRDRRANPRLAVRFSIELSDLDYSYRGEVLDLSPGGARVSASPAPPLGTELDLVLRPRALPALKLKGRVAHAAGQQVGIVFDLAKAGDFEQSLNLYETLLMGDSALAIRVKQRPTAIAYTARLYPRPIKGVTLTGPEHWVLGMLKPEGTLLWDLRRALGAEWQLMTHVPFMLLERGAASLQPASPEDLEPEPAGEPVA
jgi:hypothetical protein